MPLPPLCPLPGAPFALLVARLASPYPSVQSLTSLLEAFPGTSPQPQGSPEPVLCFPWGWTSRTPIGRAACLVISATLPQGRNLLSWGCAQWLEQSPAHLSGMNQVPSSWRVFFFSSPYHMIKFFLFPPTISLSRCLGKWLWEITTRSTGTTISRPFPRRCCYSSGDRVQSRAGVSGFGLQSKRGPGFLKQLGPGGFLYLFCILTWKW